jgi:hypothetical protein
VLVSFASGSPIFSWAAAFYFFLFYLFYFLDEYISSSSINNKEYIKQALSVSFVPYPRAGLQCTCISVR